ncbi:hypothetical protein P43SY_004139 [Pythium insidiosum]|uniref:NACHT domain-containing protein n=1 Tax=Pythium insidiosum TaxID=114742 RepID=A0AAD5LY60_PYTIN|nr:hypothetical protein P43SY_004139 [Pythium insidiosum]
MSISQRDSLLSSASLSQLFPPPPSPPHTPSATAGRASSSMDPSALDPAASAPSRASAKTATSAAAAGNSAASECWDSVAFLESAFHHGFMRSRLRTGDFVYCENARLTRELDEFCDVDSMYQPKGPILLLGESGIGKSAFLANWLVRRKKMFQNWQSSYPEFIFFHVVGCSRQSLYVSNLLERILREIKEYFELNKEIPDIEERLSWQFPRFLEAASKKGRIILIIDGLQRLRTTDGESILKWVPLVFPPNVRLVFSGTVSSPSTKFLHTVMPSMGGATAAPPMGRPGIQTIDQLERPQVNAQMIDRIKLEATRRNWTLLSVSPLLEEERWGILKRFLRKYPAQRASGSRLSSPSNSRRQARGASSGKGENQHQPASCLARHGLMLFDLQQRAIVSVAMAATPHFLKIFLTALAWAVNEGFNIHHVFEAWLASESSGQLLESVLRSMETGYVPDPQSTEDAQQFIQENRLMTAPATPSPTKRRTTTNMTLLSQQLSSERRLSGSEPLPHSVATTRKLTTTHSRKLPDLGYDEVATEETEPDVETAEAISAPDLQRQRSQHEMTEVFFRTEGGRPDAQKPVLTIPLLSPMSSADSNDAKALNAVSLAQASSSLAFSASEAMIIPPRNRHSSVVSSSSGFNTVPVRPELGVTVKDLHMMPEYLTGGVYVPGLGELLGHALGLLYVSRHGLLQNELKFILNAVVTEEKQTAQAEPGLQRKASFATVTSITDESPTAFTEEQWRALQRALKTLGVLSVQDVLVLPICKDVLRDVVWWRYIGSERGEQKYHQWLIRFFRIHPTTFRRVEELPWHLKRCYHWDALRSVLVNLPMFQLMYTANFKSELFSYWRLLIDGPLPLYNAAEQSAHDGLSYTLPFDIVKEYGKSVDAWYKSARPTTKAFTAVVALVTKFMFEFSLFYQGYLPVFNHSPFALDKLQQDGFTFSEELPHVAPLLASPAVSSSASSGLSSQIGMTAASATATTALTTALQAFPGLCQQLFPGVVQKDKETNGNWFFFYQRWVWVHFPWLSLSREITVRDPSVEIAALGRVAAAPNGAAATAAASTSSGNGSSGSGPGTSLDTLAGLYPENEDLSLDPQQRDGAGPAGTTASGGSAGSGGAVGGGNANPSGNPNARSLLFDVRFWDVRKSLVDPTHEGKLKGATSPAKLRGLQNAVAHGSTQTQETEKVISPENLFRKKSVFAAVKNVLHSSVRALPNSASSPLLPSTASPASSTFLTEPGAFSLSLPPEVSKDDDAAISLPSRPLKALGSKTLGSKDLGGLESLDVGGASTSASAFGLPAHFQDYPQNEWDLKRSYNYELVLKLQTLYDSAHSEVKKKQSHLQTVKKKIAETQKRYELTMRECDMAKHAVEEMNARLEKIEAMIRGIERQEKGHRKLLRSCQTYPATDPWHFETVKKELKVSQMRVKDLEEEKKVLALKKTHLQSVELPIIQREIERNKQLLSAVVAKLERARDKMAQDQAATDKLYQRRLEMLENVRKAAPKDPESSLEQEAHSAAQIAVSASTRSLAAKVALQQCESMCDKIQKATGFTKLELILDKFVSREELIRSFEEQAKVYEARLKQIKLHQAELEQQLQALEMSNAVATVDDPRVLEEKLRVAEVELARTDRTQNALLTMSKEVIAGASRIVKLMGITSCRTPHQGAIPAAQLWPPPIDVGSALTSEFETLDSKEIANLLQICQERAVLMLDVVEGGRADPDANFTTVPPALPNQSESLSLPHAATPEVDEDDQNLDVLSRDAIKAASKSKLTTKRRAREPAAETGPSSP